MATAAISDFMRRLTRQMAAARLAERSDTELVKLALAGENDAAFEAIVWRHGGMVYRVCWRVLQQTQDAEDAFQATFLVLAQKLRSVRKHASLASWLHGVARRVALRAKTQSTARRRRETLAPSPGCTSTNDLTSTELSSALDRELGCLPENHRLPLVLCYMEGRTQDEAARQLGWSKSTLRRRLEEARDTLGQRLTSQGIAWSVAAAAVLVSDCVSSAAPAPALIASTVEVAAGVAAGSMVGPAASAKVAALTEGVIKVMLLNKLKTVVAVLLVAATLSGVVGVIFQTQATGSSGAPQAGDKSQSRKTEVAPRKQPQQHDKEMESELKRFVGTWKIVSATVIGQGDLPKDDRDRNERTIYDREGNWEQQSEGQTIYAGKVTAITTTDKPKTIDFKVLKGGPDAVGKTVRAIYEFLDDDTYRFCGAAPGKDRPADFSHEGYIVSVLKRVKEDTDQRKKPEEAPGKKPLTLEKALETAKAMAITDDGAKIHQLANIGGAQARAGDKEGARKTLQLALDLIKDVGKKAEVYKVGCFSAIAVNQNAAGDLDGLRKTLAAVQDLIDKTDNETTKLNAGFTVAGIKIDLAAAQARAGDSKGALKLADEIDDIHRQLFAYRQIAVEQAKRKDFAGAIDTLGRVNSIRKAEMLMDIALIQEKTDKTAAAKTWKLVLDALGKLDISDEQDLRQTRVEAVVRNLADRGHRDAVVRWIEGLRSPVAQVRLLLVLAEGK